LSILSHLLSAYKLWFEFKKHIPKSARYTLAEKVDRLFIEVLELIFIAQYLKQKQKLPALLKANTKFDSLKFFLQVLWETKNLELKHYKLLSENLNEIGRMLGGWLKRLQTELAPRKKRGA
jgi:hypothetical protein